MIPIVMTIIICFTVLIMTSMLCTLAGKWLKLEEAYEAQKEEYTSCNR